MKYQIVRTALHVSAWALSGVCLFSNAAVAQVSLSPLIIEAQAHRGKSDGVINLTNSSNEPFRTRVYVQFFTYGDQGFQTVSPNSSDLSPYLQFSPRELTVTPKQSRRIRLISRLAPNLPDGEYRAVVFTENLKQTTTLDENGTAINLKTRIGVTVYVRKGKVSPNLAVDSASFNDKQKQIQILVRNKGKASTRTSLKWTLKQGKKIVKTGEVAPSTIIAESQRNLLLDFPEKEAKIAPGNYQITGELMWGENKNKSRVPFNINVNLPPQTTSSLINKTPLLNIKN